MLQQLHLRFMEYVVAFQEWDYPRANLNQECDAKVSIGGRGIQNLSTVSSPALLFLCLSIPAVTWPEFRAAEGQGLSGTIRDKL